MVFGDEVAGEDGSEGAGGTGDQDGALVPPHLRASSTVTRTRTVTGIHASACTGVGAGRDRGEAWCVECAVAEGELRFAGRKDGCGVDVGAGRDVGEDDPSGVLGLGHADESGHAGGGQVGDVFVVDGCGAAGDDD
ncbi:hypothetical protein ADL00_19295, partial [Streptomyces sp. AS58]